jgi:hypothetical protein
MANAYAEKYRGYSLVFGDSSFSVKIIAYHPASAEENRDKIIQCLNSIDYDTAVRIDPLKLANFHFDNKSKRFQFLTYTDGQYIYGESGQSDNISNLNSIFSILRGWTSLQIWYLNARLVKRPTEIIRT